MTLEDIKYLLIYTRKVFGVKYEYDETTEFVDFNPDKLRKQLVNLKKWQIGLTISVIIDLITITGLGIYGYVSDVNIIIWLSNYWYFIFVFLLPIIICIVGIIVNRNSIRITVNKISIENFEEVFKILNEFEVFGGKK